MITLKKAYELAQAFTESDFPLSRTAVEADNFWVFYLDTDEILIGPRPVAVDKKDGRTWSVFPPSMTAEQCEALDNAKEVEVSIE